MLTDRQMEIYTAISRLRVSPEVRATLVRRDLDVDTFYCFLEDLQVDPILFAPWDPSTRTHKLP